jgi:hypothetical protein
MSGDGRRATLAANAAECAAAATFNDADKGVTT